MDTLGDCILMPAHCVHRYENAIGPISKGTVAVQGALALPATGTTTFKLMKEVYDAQGIYTIFTYSSLSGGTITNISIDDTDIQTIGLRYKAGSIAVVGNSITIIVESV
jgi:hypothetical protein